MNLFDASERAATALVYFDRTFDYAALDALADRLAFWCRIEACSVATGSPSSRRIRPRLTYGLRRKTTTPVNA